MPVNENTDDHDYTKRIRDQAKDGNIFYMVHDILKEHPLTPKK